MLLTRASEEARSETRAVRKTGFADPTLLSVLVTVLNVGGWSYRVPGLTGRRGPRFI